MKKAIDNNGFEVEVSDDTVVKTIDGVNYLLNDNDLVEIAVRDAEYIAQAPARALKVVLEKRIKEYGTIGDQLDMIYHDGIDTWKAHILTVKQNNPK